MNHPQKIADKLAAWTQELCDLLDEAKLIRWARPGTEKHRKLTEACTAARYWAFKYKESRGQMRGVRRGAQVDQDGVVTKLSDPAHFHDPDFDPS